MDYSEYQSAMYKGLPKWTPERERSIIGEGLALVLAFAVVAVVLVHTISWVLRAVH